MSRKKFTEEIEIKCYWSSEFSFICMLNKKSLNILILILIYITDKAENAVGQLTKSS